MIIAISQIGVYCLRFAILNWGPTLLKETKQVSLINAVWVVAIFEAAGVLGTLSSGFVTDRFFGGRAHRTSQVSLALSLTSLILFLAIPNATMGVYLLLLSLAGFFTYSAQIQGTTAVAKLATRSAAGTASGFIGLRLFKRYLYRVWSRDNNSKLWLDACAGIPSFAWIYSVSDSLICMECKGGRIR